MPLPMIAESGNARAHYASFGRRIQSCLSDGPGTPGEALLRDADRLLDQLVEAIDCGAKGRRDTLACQLTGDMHCLLCTLAESDSEGHANARERDESWDALQACLQLLDVFRRKR